MGAWWCNDKKRGRCCFLIGRRAEGMKTDRSETEGTSFVYDGSTVLDRTPPADRSKIGGRENTDRRRIGSSRRRRPERFPPREKRARPGGDPLRRATLSFIPPPPRPDHPGNDARRAHYFAACRFHTARPQPRRRPVCQCSVPGAGRGVCRRFSWGFVFFFFMLHVSGAEEHARKHRSRTLLAGRNDVSKQYSLFSIFSKKNPGRTTTIIERKFMTVVTMIRD